MINVLESTKFVVNNSRLVNILTSAVQSLCDSVKESDLNVSESGWTHYQWTYKKMINLLFVFDTVNFCYWAGKGQTKWAVNIGGQSIDGSIALLRCIEEEMKKNPEFTNPKNLSNLNEDNWRRITNGNVEIPLFHERLECLRELGIVVYNRFEGSYEKVIVMAQGNAMKLLETIINIFPKFRDTSMFQGKEVGFYKRAQLLVKGISDAMITDDQEPLEDIDKLSAFADYKIPQLLRRLGVIEYAPKLSEKIDDYDLIEAGSQEEVEIRANTVWAIEEIRANLSNKFRNVTAAQVDSILWGKSQEKSKDEKPYHRTLTMGY